MKTLSPGGKTAEASRRFIFYPHIIDFLGYVPFEVSEEILGGRIKAFRLTRGLSQKKMGKLLSVDGSTICSWETGQTIPYKRMIEKIVKILDNEAT